MFADIKNHWKNKVYRKKTLAWLNSYNHPVRIMSDAEYDIEYNKARTSVLVHDYLAHVRTETTHSIEYVGGEPLRVDVLGGNLVRFTNPS